MDELEQIAAEIEAESPAPDLPPDDGAVPETAQDDLAEKLAQAEQAAEEARQNAAALEQRLRDTQAWANNQNMARLAAETAAAVVDRRALESQPPPEPPQVPRLTAEERDMIFSDPDLYERHVQAVAKYGYDLATQQFRQEMNRISPLLNAGREAAMAVESMLPLNQELAVNKAKVAAEKEGVAEEDFTRHLPVAHEFIVTASRNERGEFDRAKYRALSTNPEAIVMAVRHARSQNGVPITQKSPIPPTIGAKASVRKPAAPAKSPAILKAERDLGVVFGPAEIEEYNRLNQRTARR